MIKVEMEVRQADAVPFQHCLKQQNHLPTIQLVFHYELPVFER